MLKLGVGGGDAGPVERTLRLKKPHVWIRSPKSRQLDGDMGDRNGGSPAAGGTATCPAIAAATACWIWSWIAASSIFPEKRKNKCVAWSWRRRRQQRKRRRWTTVAGVELYNNTANCRISEQSVRKRGVWRNCGWSDLNNNTAKKRRQKKQQLKKSVEFSKNCSKMRSTAKLWLEWSQQQHSDATRTAKKKQQKKQRERASNRLEMFLISICVWLNTAACERLYETGGITNEGGEKTILQSNNMVALRVSLLYLGMVWYDNIKDDIRDDIYQRLIKYVHIPTGTWIPKSYDSNEGGIFFFIVLTPILGPFSIRQVFSRKR